MTQFNSEKKNVILEKKKAPTFKRGLKCQGKKQLTKLEETVELG